MLIFTTAAIAARRRAIPDPPKVLLTAGPPLWWMILEELANDVGRLWKRFTRMGAKHTDRCDCEGRPCQRPHQSELRVRHGGAGFAV